MKRSIIFFALFFHCFSMICAQVPANGGDALRWADSVLKSLSPEEKIAQMMILRSSGPAPAGSYTATFYDKEVEEAIRKYNIGGICFFQGGPKQQVARINYFQQIAKTPLLVTIDAEWGLGMRMDSVMPLPRAMMAGAMQDPDIMYEYGRVVGNQCRRAGFQVNYAPVMDVNNNPENPVINDRSFGENRFRVAEMGIAYMKGLQDVGIIASAKHFPGHGDVAVDSHHDLPLINKSKSAMDSLELYPFQKAIQEGILSVMAGHLSVPAIDPSENIPTSISPPTITGLLKKEMGFRGLVFTDALEMKGITKYFSSAEISLRAVLAGIDLLCLPSDIPGSIEAIKKAIKKRKIAWKEIDARVLKILLAKYNSGLHQWSPVRLQGLTEDLNSELSVLHRRIAEHAITLLKKDDPLLFPLQKGKKIAYVGIGTYNENAFARAMRSNYDAHTYFFDYKQSEEKAMQLASYLNGLYDAVIIGVHNYSRRPANNFGISAAAETLVHALQEKNKTLTFVFGNPYAIKKFCNSNVLIACYEDDRITQETAADLLAGRFEAKGKLPVSVCDNYIYGSGLVAKRLLHIATPSDQRFDSRKLSRIDSIVADAIQQKAIPGGVVLVARNGTIVYEKSFGHLTYENNMPVYPETIYDLASVTKIMATTVSVMKLYDEGKIDLQKTIGDYLPWVQGSNKAPITLWDILLHQAGLKAWIPFYKETVDTTQGNIPLSGYYCARPDNDYSIRVAENMYMRNDWVDSMYARILRSEVGPAGKYIYSDNDFIFLGKIVEAVSGKSLDTYVRETFYEPLEMKSTGFRPRDRFSLNTIAPTENENGFRQQLIHGDVHDPGAAMFGGVAGHAGLFSNAYDLSVLAEVLLNGGQLNGTRFFKKETIDYFTSYQAESRRGIGFDKPEKDNATRPEPYPARFASPLTFGHTGFTGTCVWMDPAKHLTFIMLSNRVHNNGDSNKFLRMNVRPKVLDTIYQAMLD